MNATFAQLDTKEYDHPIYIASRQLTSAEINYTVTEQEVLVEEILTLLAWDANDSGDRSPSLDLSSQQTKRDGNDSTVYHFTSKI